MVVNLTENDRLIIQDYLKAKAEFDAAKRVYDDVVAYKLKTDLDYSKEGLELTDNSGKKWKFRKLAGASFWRRTKEYTADYVAMKVPEAFEQATRKDSLRLTRVKDDDDR